MKKLSFSLVSAPYEKQIYDTLINTGRPVIQDFQSKNQMTMEILMKFYNNLLQNSAGKTSLPMSVEFFMIFDQNSDRHPAQKLNFDFYENDRTWKKCQKLFTNNKHNLRLSVGLIQTENNFEQYIN